MLGTKGSTVQMWSSEVSLNYLFLLNSNLAALAPGDGERYRRVRALHVRLVVRWRHRSRFADVGGDRGQHRPDHRSPFDQHQQSRLVRYLLILLTLIVLLSPPPALYNWALLLFILPRILKVNFWGDGIAQRFDSCIWLLEKIKIEPKSCFENLPF